MSKNRKLTDFFKPFASPRAKRPLPVDEDQSSITVAHSNRVISDPLNAAINTDVTTPEHPAAPVQPSAIKDHALRSPVLPALVKSEPEAQPRPGCGESASPNDSWGAPSGVTFCDSSRQRLRDGQLVIKSSDDEDSTSDSSLDDLNGLLTARKPRMEPTPISAAGDMIPRLDRGTVHTRAQTRAGRLNGRANTSSTSRLPVVPRYKFSLDSLVRQTERDTTSESDVAKARSLFRAAEGELDVQGMLAKKQEATTADAVEQVDENLLASVISGSGEGASLHKVLNTMRRTEALHRARSWLFFQDGRPQAKECQTQPFPTNALTSPCWHVLTKGLPSRRQLFLSGHLEDVTTKKMTLPDEVYLWILHSACVEPSEDLRGAYVKTLRDAESHTHRLVQPSTVDELFGRLGAKPEAVNVGKPAVPEPTQVRLTDDGDWAGVLPVLDALANISAGLSTETREHAICLVARLTLDAAATTDCVVSAAVDDVLTSLVCSIPEANREASLLWIGMAMFNSTVDSQLRLQLISSLPAYTSVLGLLRRRLALAFFFENPSFLSKAPQDLLDLSTITDHLLRPAFDIKVDADYAQLAARISILDIAIDQGVSSVDMCDLHGEVSFNREVDSLAKTIKAMFTGLVDSGASHMSRTEAKEVLRILHYRLIYAVRTKQEPKSSLFGCVTASGQGEGQHSTKAITTFLSHDSPINELAHM